MKWTFATAALALLFVLLSAMSGVYRKGALLGSTISGTTALLSMLCIARAARAKRPMQAALLVVTVAFLLRIVLVALGTAFAVSSGKTVLAFVVSFFIPFFVFAALEVGHVHSLRHGTGPA